MIDRPEDPRERGRRQGSAPREIVAAYLRDLRSIGYASSTIAGRTLHLRTFTRWTALRAIDCWTSVDEPALEQYRAWVVDASRGRDGRLAWSTIHSRLSALRLVCAWALRTHRAGQDPSVSWVLPRVPRRLPRAVLSSVEVEKVLSRADLTTPLGLRDRAVMELMYSTGIRRGEAIGLDCGDLQAHRRALFVREGKGGKDRVVPIGDRALAWVDRYVREVRSSTPGRLACPALFLSTRGTRVRPTRLTERLHAYVIGANLGKSGSCHIFRHTMATLMHDRGADIRDLQELLGHAELATTQIYTHVSVERLRAVHSRTHPAEIGLRGGVAGE